MRPQQVVRGLGELEVGHQLSEIAHSREELYKLLQEQLGFLRKSSREYDSGDESEAVRLAVTIRLLVHNTKASSSLLKQLGVQHQLRLLDTAMPLPRPKPGNLVVFRFDPGLAVIHSGTDGAAHFRAPLDDLSEDTFGLQPFRVWWNRPILEDLRRQRFTRKELVLFMANKVGGAHIDPSIESRFHALTKLNSTGWGWKRIDENQYTLTVPADEDDEPLGNPVPANVRQIAFETEQTASLVGKVAM